MPDNAISNAGFTWDLGNVDNYSGGSSVTGNLGRFWNNLTGRTASNEFNAAEAEKARLFNSAEAERDRQWQTEMSNTAYQRAAADMKAAGINPASLGGNATMSPASSGSAHTVHGDSASASSGGTSLLGVVMQGLGLALKNKIANSAVKFDREGMDLKKFIAESDKALDAAKIADLKVTTAMKERTKRLQTNHDLKVAAEQAKSRRIERERRKRERELSDDELDRMIDGLYGRNG